MTVFEGAHWAVVELMGHRTRIGLVSQGPMGMLAINALGGGVDGRGVEFYGPGAIYGIRLVTEEVARAAARDPLTTAARPLSLGGILTAARLEIAEAVAAGIQGEYVPWAAQAGVAGIVEDVLERLGADKIAIFRGPLAYDLPGGWDGVDPLPPQLPDDSDDPVPF
jgi:hypothetical protein